MCSNLMSCENVSQDSSLKRACASTGAFQWVCGPKQRNGVPSFQNSLPEEVSGAGNGHGATVVCLI